MQYTAKYGNTISDTCLNANGDISAWPEILALNEFESWCPILIAGQVLQVPDTINPITLPPLQVYPTNNASISDIDSKIDIVFEILAASTPETPPVIIPEVIDTNKYYTIEYGESVVDWVLNSTGNLNTWPLIVTANSWEDWVPELVAGDKVIIPATALPDPNSLRALQTYPANNASVPDVYNQINSIFNILIADRWILRNHFWDDNPGRWEDTAQWLD